MNSASIARIRGAATQHLRLAECSRNIHSFFFFFLLCATTQKSTFILFNTKIVFVMGFIQFPENKKKNHNNNSMPCIGKPAAARYTYAMHVNSRLSWLGRVRMKNKINIEKKPSSTKTNIPRCVSLVTPFLRFHPQFLPVDRSQSTVFTHGKYQLNGSE